MKDHARATRRSTQWCMLYDYLRFLWLQHSQTHAQTPRAGSSVASVSTNTNANNTSGAYPSDDAVRRESLLLVLGKAIPEGETVYLLVRDSPPKHIPQQQQSSSSPTQPVTASWFDGSLLRSMRDSIQNFTQTTSQTPAVLGGEEGEFLVIDPCKGHVYSVRDPYCPLKEIYCLATPYNLWANVQPSAAPHAISYDVLNSDCWRPFFGRRCAPPPAGLRTVQEPVSYYETRSLDCRAIEEKVHAAIRHGVRSWRNQRYRAVPTFKTEACNVIKELLPLLEEWKRDG